MLRRFALLVPVLASTLATVSLACTQRAAPSPPVVTSGDGAAPIAPVCDEPVAAAPPAEPSPPPPVPMAAPPADPAAHDMARVLREANTPPELLERGTTARLWDDHAIDDSINPFYLRGDFDGDGRPDYLVSVLRKDAKATGDGPPQPRLVVLRGIAGKGAAVWLEEGEALSLPARDGWYVHGRRSKVPVGFDGTAPPRLVGDAFVMMKAESSSALVYWNGKRFASHWLGD